MASGQLESLLLELDDTVNLLTDADEDEDASYGELLDGYAVTLARPGQAHPFPMSVSHTVDDLVASGHRSSASESPIGGVRAVKPPMLNGMPSMHRNDASANIPYRPRPRTSAVQDPESVQRVPSGFRNSRSSATESSSSSGRSPLPHAQRTPQGPMPIGDRSFRERTSSSKVVPQSGGNWSAQRRPSVGPKSPGYVPTATSPPPRDRMYTPEPTTSRDVHIPTRKEKYDSGSRRPSIASVRTTEAGPTWQGLSSPTSSGAEISMRTSSIRKSNGGSLNGGGRPGPNFYSPTSPKLSEEQIRMKELLESAQQELNERQRLLTQQTLANAIPISRIKSLPQAPLPANPPGARPTSIMSRKNPSSGATSPTLSQYQPGSLKSVGRSKSAAVLSFGGRSSGRSRERKARDGNAITNALADGGLM